MKNLSVILVVCIFISCNNSSGNETGEKRKDSSLSNSNIDTPAHPSGVDNSAVISTDTAAINVQNTFKKADSIANEKKK